MWAQAMLDGAELSALVPGTTYLFEAIYPENRIVVRYTEPALVLLAAYAADGRDLPEEFWGDFDDIIRLLSAKVEHLEARVAQVAAEVAPLSDKELGLALKMLPADARPYLFAYRKSGAITGKARDSLMREVRPTGNVLEGYVPAYVMGRVLDEAIS